MNSTKKQNSFVIDIKDTQHESWQGTIRWINNEKEETFRSALELIKMIDSSLNCDKEGALL